MADNIKEKAVKGIFWSFFDRGGSQAIQFLIGIYIARILTPEDYGLVGMLSIFLVVSNIFTDSGFGQALIQQGKKTTRKDFSSVFYFNITVSILLYLILYFCSPLIAAFYNEPRLILLLRVLGLNIPVLSFGLIQNTIIVKNIRFSTLTKINLLSIVVASVGGIIMAKKGAGVWALAELMLAQSFLKTVLLWFVNRWRPSFEFSISSIRQLFSFGSRLLISGTIQQLNKNLFSLIIGKFYSVVDVGYYSQSLKMNDRVSNTITQSIQAVLFPTHSLIKDNLSRFKNAVRTNVKTTTFIIFPVLTGLIAIAHPFIELTLTVKWLPSVIYLQLLALSGIFFTLTRINRAALAVFGKVDVLLKFTLYSNLVLVVMIFIMVYFKVNLTALISGQVVWQFLDFFFFFIYFQGYINYKFSEYFRDVLPALVIAFVMGMVTYTIGQSTKVSWESLFLQIFLGIILYGLLSYFFNRESVGKITGALHILKNGNKDGSL